MKNKEKKGLVPRLRFPEFREAGEWEEKWLGSVYSFKVTNSFSRDKLNYNKGELKNIHYGDIHTKFSALFDITKEKVPFVSYNQSIDNIKPESYCQESDMIFADASEDLDDVGKSIEIINLNNERLLSGLHTLLARQKKRILANGFGGHLFQSPAMRKLIKREAQGAKVLGISAGRLSKINMFFPLQEEEQQQISGCLSSLDALITAQAQKIDALKAHKKGLMQQLFPAEGETTPELRFPEFRDAGAWKSKKIRDFAKVTTGNKDTQNKVNNGAYPFFVRSQKVERINSFSYNGEAILTSGDGVGVGKNFHYIIGKFNFHQRVYCIFDFDKYVLGWFVFQYFSEHFYKRVMQLSAKNSVDSVRMSMITEMPIRIPLIEEQQKIANCLSSLDAMITAQAQNIDALKAHKKGLMQQLFPNDDE